MLNKNMSSHLEKESYPKHFHIMFEIQIVAGNSNYSDAFSDENRCTTLICLFTKNQTPMGK